MKSVNDHPRRILTVAAGLLLSVGVLLSHRFLPNQASDLSIEAIRSLHGPGFGVVAILILMLVRNGNHRAVAYLKAAAFATVLAGLSEAAQIPGPRDAQFADLLTDALGIVVFLGTVAVFDRSFRDALGKGQRVLLAAVSVSALLATLLPTLWLSYALVHRGQSLPQILRFDAVWERAYSSGNTDRLMVIPSPAEWPVTQGNVAQLVSAGRSGIMLRVYRHPDWSGYAAVSFVAATGGETSRRIAVGIRDIRPSEKSAEARYMAGFNVSRQPTRYRIMFEELRSVSAEREFDIEHVHNLVISDWAAESGVEILVGDFRLER
jgi:VanZ family protein